MNWVILLLEDAVKETTECTPFLDCHPKRVLLRSSDVQLLQVLQAGLSWRDCFAGLLEMVESGVLRKTVPVRLAFGGVINSEKRTKLGYSIQSSLF